MRNGVGDIGAEVGEHSSEVRMHSVSEHDRFLCMLRRSTVCHDALGPYEPVEPGGGCVARECMHA